MEYQASVIFLLVGGVYYNARTKVYVPECHRGYAGNIVGSCLESQVATGTIVKRYYPGRHD